jgi:fructokinase
MERDHLLVTEKEMSTHDIVLRAEAGDAECDETLHRYERRLARGLAHVINVLDPDVIVLGGGMGNIERLYTHVPMLWGEWVFSDTVRTRLVAPEFGDSSGVRGAAWLWAE